MMTKINTISYFIAVTVFVFAGFFAALPVYAHAANLEVDFETNPLFSETNFLPGNGSEKDIDVANNSDTPQDIIVEAINAIDDDGLGDALGLIIKEGVAMLYDDTLGNFLRDGEVFLSTLGSGGATTYTFNVSFDSSAGNELQEGTLGFDLCVGFRGGELSCGDTVISDEGDTEEEDGNGNGDGGGTITGTGGSGGGGGGGNGPISTTPPLEISGVAVVEVDIGTGVATITWNTNLLSTSQVVYGLKSGGPYSLNLTVLPFFGYPEGTLEDSDKVINHSVSLSGLVPGEGYKFRVVSRASPPTVGYEYEFEFNEGQVVPTQTPSPASSATPAPAPTTVPSGGTLPVEVSDTNVESSGNVIEVGGSDEDASNEEVSTEEAPQTLAGLLTAFPDGFGDWVWCVAFFLVVLLALWVLWTLIRKWQERELATKKQMAVRRSAFFIGGFIVAILLAYFLSFSCVLIPLLTLLFMSVVSLFWYWFR